MTESALMRMPEEFADLHVDRWTAPFWEAARRHSLVAARCAECGEFRPMPPGPYCWNCRSLAMEWVSLSGDGIIHTFTIVRQAFFPSLEPLVPYVVAIISLEDAPGVRLMSNVLTADVDAVSIGQRVHVVWDDFPDGTTMPRFAPE